MISVMDAHDRAVSSISSTVQAFYARQRPFRIYHGSTNSTRKTAFQRSQMVDTSGLTHVLGIDIEKKTALVEPNVPMDALVEATLKYEFLPPVVPEFPGITVGGAMAGTAGESSSFKYGFFDRTVNWIEIVLATGEVVTASRTEKADLFYGTASSFGTLGVTTLLELQLIPAKAYVKLEYYAVPDILSARKLIDRFSKDNTVDYLDGIMFAKDDGVICSGKLVDGPEDSNGAIQRFSRARDPWFYINASRLPFNLGKSGIPITEYVPVVDYLFRYDRGGFWVGRYAFTYFITPFNQVTRFLLDYCMHTRVMYHALHKSGLSNMYIIQDVAIPYPKIEKFMEYLDEEFKQYPIWICPLKQTGRNASIHGLQTARTQKELPELMLNFGVWGPGPKQRREFVMWNRRFERKVQELGGQKWLYAQAYYTEEEFDEIYKKDAYDKLREKYGARYLPSVYDKVKVDVEGEGKAIRESWRLWFWTMFWSIWPLAGLYGVYKVLRGGDYLLARKEKIAVPGKKEM
ncbi:hypothetical protein BJ878DRAFT_501831 [Calycina marina]|uniref:Delta(24)-sterol reductase n=1 Tax=Calycina marina TaxID=1763456 RepID=A0A9P8CG53_9HELO|nr:hypothetical protein BJ878DRAFT_501831 [Calycina marina]